MHLTQTQIKNGWKVVKLGEVVGLQQGLAINIKSKHLLVEKSSLPLLRITDLINKKEVQFVNEELIQNQFIAENDSLIYSRTGQVGLVFKNRKGVVHNNCFKIIPFDVLKKDFLYQVLKQDTFYKSVNQIAQKAAQPDLTHTAFKSLQILLPPLQTQEKIAYVLSAYDDLIENNDRRIKVLEAMAQKLYTEWFVNFKFPGYEKVKMLASGHPDFGMIPEGWEIRRISEIGKVITGKTPSTTNKKFFNGEILFIKTPDIHGNVFIINSGQTLSDSGADSQKSKTLPAKTVFVSCIGTLGSVGITSKPSQTNQQINAVLLNNVEDYIFLYFFLVSSKKQLVNLGSNGATMGNLNKDKFEKIEIILPKRKILDMYNQNVSLYFEQILNLQKQNQNLKKSRDFLVPQLVGGRVEVK